MEYTLKELLNTTHQSQAEINGKWVPARPVPGGGMFLLKRRLRAAWRVLIGKVDTVVWPEGQ